MLKREKQELDSQFEKLKKAYQEKQKRKTDLEIEQFET